MYPQIFEITKIAAQRFTAKERKCIYNDPEKDWPNNLEFNLELLTTFNEVFKVKSNYSCSACLINAALRNGCPGLNILDWWTIYGRQLGCFNQYRQMVGDITWTNGSTQDGTNQTILCEVACARQENSVITSRFNFPDPVFVESDDYWLVVHKLFFSCHPSKIYKRDILSRRYPNLCGFYDRYFYNNETLSTAFSTKKGDTFLTWMKATAVEELFNMTEEEREEFTAGVLEYSRENLVKILAYIASPFVTVYLTDQVVSVISLISSIGGLLGLCMGFSFVTFAEILYYTLVDPFLSNGDFKKPGRIKPGPAWK